MDPRHVVISIGLGRIGIGASLLMAPALGRIWLGEAAGGAAAKAAARAIGGRDLALGVGLLLAHRRNEPITGWVAAGALADASDAAATLLSYRQLPSKTRLPILLSAAATAAVEVAIGARLRRSPGQERALIRAPRRSPTSRAGRMGKRSR